MNTPFYNYGKYHNTTQGAGITKSTMYAIYTLGFIIGGILGLGFVM